MSIVSHLHHFFNAETCQSYIPYGQKIETRQFIESYTTTTIPPVPCLLPPSITPPRKAATK